MIRRLQALNYRCLRYADVPLGRFQVLVGPNASGKSTLFDIISFLSYLVSHGFDEEAKKRARELQELAWERPGKNPGFELAVEFDVPEDVKALLPQEKDFAIFRYEIAIKEDKDGKRIHSERGILMPNPPKIPPRRPALFPCPPEPPETILTGGRRRGSRTILSSSCEGRDNFYAETAKESGKGGAVKALQGTRYPALSNLPECSEEFFISTQLHKIVTGLFRRPLRRPWPRPGGEKFPMATHVARTLKKRVTFLGGEMRHLGHPSYERHGGFSYNDLELDFPWVVKRFQEEHEKDYGEWLAHVRTTLPDLADIRFVKREDDRAYLMLRYKTGVEIPSWTTSDGTLRFLALTLLAYLPVANEVYILEEPEYGMHPLALDAVYDSLSSLYDSQVLIATYSPVFLGLAKPRDVLCFAKNDEGATDIVRGDAHPFWRGAQEEVGMNPLFAKAVIG